MISSFAAALAVSAIGMLFILPMLKRAQIMDIPNARSSHVKPVPRGGGASVAVAMLVGCVLGALQEVSVEAWGLVGILAFAVLGFLDDVRNLTAYSRLIVQVSVAALLVTAAGLSFHPSSLVVAVLGVLWLVGYTNVFNFMDGINGISAMNAAIAGVWYALLGNNLEIDSVKLLGLVTSAAAIGFFPWNAPNARVFLGDVGSYALGFSVSWLAISSYSHGAPLVLALAPAILYLADTSSTMVMRLSKGES